MRLGVISDIHDNIWALETAMAHLADCDVLLSLGDLCAPFTMTAMAEAFGKPVHHVWGNNDGDKLLIAQKAAQSGNVTIHGDMAELEFGGRKIALVHYPHLGRALAAGEQYDLVCYGHDHTRALTWMGRSLLLNPGEVMGRFGVHSVAVYDTERGTAKIVEWSRSG